MRIFIVFVLILLILAGCSRKYGIHKTYAFSRTITAGNIPVDDNNNPTSSGVQKAHLVYIETSIDQEPVWDTAWMKGNAYSLQPFKITQQQVNLGKTKDENTEVSFSAGEGNNLWQLLMTPLAKNTPSEKVIEKLNKNPIVLSGLWKNKRVYYTIKEETELAKVFGQ